MKTYKLLTLVFGIIVLFNGQSILAQKESTIRKQVIQKLSEIKPPDDKKYIYKIVVPNKIEELPSNLRLDISYKIGHYEFQNVALRFEREKSQPFIKATKFAYGSSLAFLKKYAKPDFYISQQGKISVEDFDKLLKKAYTLYNSNIEKEYVVEKPAKTNKKGGVSAGYGVGGGSSSHSFSSSDGRIILNLINTSNLLKPIIQENGTLHADKLKDRITNGYEDLRVHLFWEVFYDYLENNQILNEIDKLIAEEIAISRLEESQTISNYTEYFRLSAYIKVLGNIGTTKAIPALEKIAKSNMLEEDWNKYLKEDALEAIRTIKLIRTKEPEPTKL